MQQKRYSSDLTERQWQRIAPLFVVQRTGKWPLQAIVNGIFYGLKNGYVWRDVLRGHVVEHVARGSKTAMSGVTFPLPYRHG